MALSEIECEGKVTKENWLRKENGEIKKGAGAVD